MFYKNTSYFDKTFYGVTFRPGEIKEVKGTINDKFMIVVDKPEASVKETKEKEVQQKPSSEKPKEDSQKASKNKPSKKDEPEEKPTEEEAKQPEELLET